MSAIWESHGEGIAGWKSWFGYRKLFQFLVNSWKRLKDVGYNNGDATWFKTWLRFFWSSNLNFVQEIQYLAISLVVASSQLLLLQEDARLWLLFIISCSVSANALSVCQSPLPFVSDEASHLIFATVLLSGLTAHRKYRNANRIAV